MTIRKVQFLAILLLSSCNYFSQSIPDSSCSVALERMMAELVLDSMDIDEKMFCQGWGDAASVDGFNFFISGGHGHTPPCMYYDVINNNGYVKFTGEEHKYKGIFFRDKPFSYYLGLNAKICAQNNVPYPKSRCGDSKYITADSVESFFKNNLFIKFDSSSIFIKLDSIDFIKELGDIAANIYINKEEYNIPLVLLYEGYQFASRAKSFKIHIPMEGYDSPFYCHAYKNKLDEIEILYYEYLGKFKAY